jgi:acetyltransferase-like isoleucine patch superfamily enzyme
MKSIICKINEAIIWLFWIFKSNSQLRRAVRSGGGKIQRGVKVRIGGTIEIGKGVCINSHGVDSIRGTQIFVSKGAKLKMGDCSGVTATSLNCTVGITLGNHVKIGAGSLLFDTDFHSTDWKDRINDGKDQNRINKAPIFIEDHVFIGARSIICKGVRIGEHTVIAAGSVVVKDIPANCLAGGNPCKIIKSFD